MNIDKNYLIKITQEVYRQTLLFPKKEPLRYKVRELADDILANALIMANHQGYTNNGHKMESCSAEIAESLEVLDSFFDVAKAQNWASLEAILAIQKEYDNLKSDLKNLNFGEQRLELNGVKNNQPASLPTVIPAENNPPLLTVKPHSERQGKIVEFIKENGRVQVWQVKEILPDVTKRTLRRDFEQMLNLGIVERIGERNNTFYQLRNR